jgi:hypothetical protein
LQIFWNAGKSDGENNGEDRDLQDLIFSDGLDDIFGEDVQDEIGPAKWRSVRRRLRCGAGRNDQTFAGFGEIDGEDSDEQSKGGDDLEVHQAFPADAADFAKVAVSGNAGDERAENKWRDNDFDEAQENVTQEAQVGRERWGVQTEFEAGEHREENPEGERALLRAGEDQQGQAEAAHCDERPVVWSERKKHRANGIEK